MIIDIKVSCCDTNRRLLPEWPPLRGKGGFHTVSHTGHMHSLRERPEGAYAVLDRRSEHLGFGTLLKGTSAVLWKPTSGTLEHQR